MTLFVAAVDGGSLAAAARRHARSPAAVTRAVAWLEREAGTPLLLRSTRALSLTPEGERHLSVWRDVLERLSALAPVEAHAPISGTIRLTAPELFGRLHVLPLVETFLRDHPQVSARLLLRNRLVELVGEGIDLAVRIAPLPDSGLSTIRLGHVRPLLCASPAYLAQAGQPARPNMLERHACIGLDADADGERWAFADAAGRRRSVRIVPRINIDHAAAGIDAALRSHGIVRAQSYQVVDHLAEGRLVRLLPGMELPPVPVSLLFPPERGARPAVRRLIDHVVPVLRQGLTDIDAALASTR